VREGAVRDLEERRHLGVNDERFDTGRSRGLRAQPYQLEVSWRPLHQRVILPPRQTSDTSRLRLRCHPTSNTSQRRGAGGRTR